MSAPRFLAAAVVLLAIAPAGAWAASMEFCQLYSREYVRVALDGATDPDLRTADSGLISFMRNRAYARCLLTESDHIPLPDVPAASDDAWSAAVNAAALARLGSEPAGVAPKEAAAGDGADWVARCRKAYRSFRAADGTVIRRGSRMTRTRCPL